MSTPNPQVACVRRDRLECIRDAVLEDIRMVSECPLTRGELCTLHGLFSMSINIIDMSLTGTQPAEKDLVWQ
jgi:hypothetical protein